MDGQQVVACQFHVHTISAPTSHEIMRVGAANTDSEARPLADNCVIDPSDHQFADSPTQESEYCRTNTRAFQAYYHSEVAWMFEHY